MATADFIYDVGEKVVSAAEYIIGVSTRETASGNYIIYAEEIPSNIISPVLFLAHVHDIAKTMMQYESVAEVRVTREGSIDACYYLDYCSNFEPDADERHKYPDNRTILDPLRRRAIT